MKIIFFILNLLLSGITVFSQNLVYEVRGDYNRPIKVETIASAIRIGDIIDGYPLNWIAGYISVDIATTTSGKQKVSRSYDDVLNLEQIRNLNAADLGSEIVFDIKYKPLPEENNVRHMHVSMTLVPAIEAEFPGGFKQLNSFLKKKVLNKISESTLASLNNIAVKFTVDEKGEVTNVIVTESSSDPKIDEIIRQLVSQQPTWKPAENLTGQQVKQEFQFKIGEQGC